MTRKPGVRTTTAVAAAALLAGAAAFAAQPPHASPRQVHRPTTAQAAQARWDAGHHRAYTMLEQATGFLLGPAWARVDVVDGKVVSAVLVPGPNGEAPDGPDPDRWAASIESLLGAAANPTPKGKVEVTYDAATGAPTSIFIDPDVQTYDDELYYTVTQVVDEQA
jgi:hypothetical protein